IKRLLPGPDCDFYLCGPGPFMKSLYDGLREWGVPPAQIHYEFFGPATVKLDGAASASTGEPAAPFQVEFVPSGLRTVWEAASGNLLELALARGLNPRYGCKAG